MFLFALGAVVCVASGGAHAKSKGPELKPCVIVQKQTCAANVSEGKCSRSTRFKARNGAKISKAACDKVMSDIWCKPPTHDFVLKKVVWREWGGSKSGTCQFPDQELGE
jgi:hypothetical protein